MKRTSYIISFTAAALLVAGGIGMLRLQQSSVTVQRMERTVTLPDLAEESALVVEGALQSPSTHIEQSETAGKLVYTDWSVLPSHAFKGVVPNPLIVSVLGGDRGGLHTVVAENTIPLKTGDRYLMFLEYRAEGNYWDLSAVRQSLFRLENGTYRNAAGDSYRLADLESELAKYPATPPPMQTLAGQAELVVYGMLKQQDVVSNITVNGESRPYTRWVVETPVMWKGSASTPLVVSIKGGQQGGMWFPYEVRADVRSGLSALMFLKKDDPTGEWRLVSTDHGFLLLTGNLYHDMRGTGYNEAELRAAISS